MHRKVLASQRYYDCSFQIGGEMAGVKQFGRDEALDRAMATFWTLGYEATSIEDLVAATGIGRGSLYGTFGDKRRLFLMALDRYWDTVNQDMTPRLSDPDPRRALERMFEALIRRNSDPKFPRGCLITNTSVESCSLGDEVARKISERIGEQETGIYHVLRKAQVSGVLNPALDARALARFFLGVAWGINAVSRTVADPEMLRDMVRVAMSVWDGSNASHPRDSKLKPSRRRERPLP